MSDKTEQGIDALKQQLSFLPGVLSRTILERILQTINYEPVIGIMGKTGAGKSSLCNALFHGDVSPISDVTACTREPLRFRLRSGNHSLILMDLPGVGESEQRDREYEALYHRTLPELDLVLWVIKADDRALSVDEQFYCRVIDGYRHRVLFVVNQADKIEPCHKWNTTSNIPSPHQSINIEAKLNAIRQLFSPYHPVCAVSVRTGWNLPSMVETMMCCLPDLATSPLAMQLQGKLCNESVKKQAREGFGSAVGSVFDTAESSSFIPAPVQVVIRKVREAVVSVASSIWDWIFF
ncbi:MULTISPECIES: GTPase family protein [unclassified Serratia (in: enterobacteria)]|uniref:GTPase family protein n=1 Tax=unclassified Serratia (in: enterobacteria) TaxID=2647522 RepID=UPI001CBB0D95|nr:MULTISPECIES: GTPase family protein [unclassified Serratia (in: enterobacteria)]UAN51614.1 GTPase family protein [Serratia sp. JSRIV002]UAN57617.1 GTPase family protein [Serratia sp. JSRIV004]